MDALVITLKSLYDQYGHCAALHRALVRYLQEKDR